MRWLGCLGAGGCWCLWSRACRRNQAGSGSFRWQGRCVRRSRLGRRGGSAAPRRLRDTGGPRWFATLGDGGGGHRTLRSGDARSAAWWSPRRARSWPAAGRGAWRAARSPAQGGTQVAERQAQQRLQLIGPRQQHRPGPGQDQPRRLDRRLRLADLPAGGPDPGPFQQRQETQRPPPPLISTAPARRVGRRHRARAAPARGQPARGGARWRKSAGRIPAAPPHQRHRRHRRRQPGSRPRTRPAPAHRAHAPA